ncbi:hypothetical protein LG943_19420 [Streptomonospora sp. S1-112]|uniref:Epoxide hydrolase n=1 Tax=Streptomonospora mangrovi TaxID=2883123 RepID=A0A9X3NNB4_9ACTN|nr:hypothetical protein [Streptomonospora mangrovi]MDA0566468.1 hypothetical protein [Streptomonospora mangrovi]
MTDLAKDLPHEAVDQDLLLTNVSIYWFTGTAGTSAELYYEDGQDWGQEETSPVPTGVSLFTVQDIALRRDEERTNNITFWADHDRGGHFAAMEAPDRLLADIREFFGRYR